MVLDSYSQTAYMTAMKVQQAGTRGFIFTFDDNISLFLIAGTRFHILCDTHLGPESVEGIRKYMSAHPRSDLMVIFNSHADWDHIWGNCACSGSFIIGHETCRSRMAERAEYDLSLNHLQVRGHVRIVLPNLTFSERLILEEDDVEFSYAPGHTVDSSICYDRRDNILYLGDLVEDPIPYLDYADLDIYLATLRKILSHQADVLISAHSGVITRDMVQHNLSYITAIRDGETLPGASFGKYEPVHRWNTNQRIFLQYEQLIRKAAGDGFDPILLLRQAGDLHGITPDELRQNLEQVLARFSSRSSHE